MFGTTSQHPTQCLRIADAQKYLLDKCRDGILLTNRERRWYNSLFPDKAQGGLETCSKVTQPESNGICLGQSPCQLGPEGGQMGLCREKLGPSGQGEGVRGEPHPSLFSLHGWWFVAVFLKGDSGDLQVRACSGPRGRLGGGPGLARAAFLAPLPARWLHAQITTSPPPLSYAGHLRLAIVSLFAEGSSRRKLTCCSPQAGSFTPSPYWECLEARQEGVGASTDKATGSFERSELLGRERCRQRLDSLGNIY